ncbi:pleckstrin homology domain-containing family G member 4B-like isoform X2 [Argiope bruennichi]|nr:pleckstrin homology domain-containing family G member 4B-like isoform X2 [Argiope bruennichi]
MDWMQAIGSDVMINDDQLTTALQHLLVSVEKGIERLDWGGHSKSWNNISSASDGSSTFPRCCHIRAHPVDTKDSSVQTTPEDEGSQEEDSSEIMKDTVMLSSDDTPVIGKYACIQDSQTVSVVRKNYVPTCESIATQTSSTLSPSKTQEKPPNDLMFALPPLAVREEDPDDGYCEHILTQPATISQVDPDLLHSEVALLPGCRDSKGRSIVVIASDAIKDGFQLSSCHLAQLLLYFHTIPKKEVIGKGFLVLIDALKHTEDFWSALDEAFCLIEANLSNVISDVLILFEENKEVPDTATLLPTSRIQFEVVSSREKLLNFIQKDQLLCQYGGDYLYDHQEWISFRKFLEPFINGCRLSGRHLVNLLEDLRGSRLPVSSALTHQMIEQQKRNVTHTFHDEQLRHLEEEGDTILKELQSYRTKSPHNHDYRENLERTSVLYDELRRAMAKLARLADKRLNRLEACLQLKTFQEESSQVLSWLCRKGNESLERHQAIADSLGAIKQQEEEFEKFYFLAMRQIEKGNDLLEEVSTFSHDSCLPKIKEENPSEPTEEDGGVHELATSLRQHLGSFTERLEGTRERIEDTAKCYQLMDKSYEWALDAMRFVSNMGIANTESAEGILRQIRCLQDYADNHLRVPEETFTEMLDLAAKLGNEKLLEQCKIVKLRCEETVDLIKTRQATLQKVKQQMEVDSLRGPYWEAEDASQTPRTMRSHSQPLNTWLPIGASTPYPGFSCHQRRRSTGGPMGVSMSQRYGSPIGSYTAFPSSYYPTKESYHLDSFTQEKDEKLLNQGLITEDLTANGPVASISKTLLDIRGAHRSGHSSSSSSSSSTSSSCKDMSIARKAPRSLALGTDSKSGKKLPRRCQMWQMRDEALEKVKAEVREQTALLRVEKLRDCQNNNRSEIPEAPNTDRIPRKSLLQPCTDPARGPVPVNTHLMNPVDSPDSNCKKESSNDVEAKSKKTLMLIMQELIQTERDYVKSLEYIIENYIPELLRDDIPQALRGQRNVVFGNIEKIYEFHYQYFLTELEHCESSPFTVGQCFLDFQPQFYLYALYNKNKPKSDALMSEYGNAFFRKKQLELQDKMDLASYLLKPVQRMGKYALLLKQLLKECPEREKEHKALKAAEEMVRFQLRHGNDLLAMDALRDCDVNVKEQGLLLRQDEFIVWQGRSRKCMRHVFLFEDLILFSKARRDPQRKGYEMYQYKHSIKTTDLGMTEQVGDSPTKFEIWFRKRKLNDTFLLQAPTPEVKQAWTNEIRAILLNQAVNNKKNRLAEMSSMGIGNKPCLDIKPSEDQISDRSISIHQLARAPRFRNSIAVSPYDIRNNRNSIISVSSSSSSGSSQSSFSFYGALNLGFEPGDSPRPLHRSHTQQSQCSTESGFCTDASMAGDSPENEQPRHKRAERSDSLLSSDSMSTNVSPTDVPPCMTKFDQSLEESLTTSM